jgi:hypothetical protein
MSEVMTLDRLRKILFGIVVVVIVIVAGLSLMDITTIVNSQKATTNTVNVSPLYTEDDKTISRKALFVNGTTHAKAVIFSGHGSANGVNYTDGGKGLIIPRGFSGVIDSKGYGAMRSSGGGKASFTFHEIGNSQSNGIITATGAAFFDANATGDLAFLDKVVAVYKDQIYNNGTDKVTAWEWK